MRIYTISDLHVDYPENLDWVLGLSRAEYCDDVLILPGDISDDFGLLSQVLENVQDTFARVFFVPGNHELWIDRDDFTCSLDKFEAVLQRCRDLGVSTDPERLGEVTVVPLFSWYDFSFGEPSRYLRRAWRDFRACQWPELLGDDAEVSAHFLSLNENRLHYKNNTVISFSHFLPRIDVMPSRIPEKRRNVYPVLGGKGLDVQVQKLRSNIHIYGHSHVNQDTTIDGIRYINNAFAYPSEDRIARKHLYCVFELPEKNLKFETPLARGHAV